MNQHCDSCIEILTAFSEEIYAHKKVTAARSYIDNNSASITSYKKNIEKKVAEQFGENAHIILAYYLPLLECIDNYERSYENESYKSYWAHQILTGKDLIINSCNQTEEEFYEILKKADEMFRCYGKSNSLIENVNNQIRRYLDTYKSIPQSFCSLFTFYWNFKVFERGKRAGFSPVELLTGKKSDDTWLDMLLENFPYEKINVTL